ncbi:peptidase inhibitor family I36 protein [Micromonospora sp. 4G55]|uniref:peptidase inhibitor family I36 protein n=1 Tax=Micromonospora sp. 4G55 TaxID=2806102 RepID=UPI001A391821|nr:peptidase inhibitor family I36 protein [Micromonospora sp. 4G55]MBM0259300.1 peptidase inhibitor family I36 protein [Micromonospora sp. 4G55]
MRKKKFMAAVSAIALGVSMAPLVASPASAAGPRCSTSWGLCVYSDADYYGYSKLFQTGDNTFTDNYWANGRTINDSITSLNSRNATDTWRIYVDSYWRGSYMDIPGGYYDKLNVGSTYNDKFSSLRTLL